MLTWIFVRGDEAALSATFAQAIARYMRFIMLLAVAVDFGIRKLF